MSENSKPKQVNRVLAHLLAHGSITQQDAMVDLGVMRLASRVSELKEAGYPITGEMVAVKNRYGETCRVKRYTLQGGGLDE